MILATWMDGFFPLGLLAIALLLSQFLNQLLELLVAGWRQYRRPLAPAKFIGWMEGLPAAQGYPEIPSTELYNLTAAVGDHPVDSTVSRQTLERHGFRLPKTPRPISTGSSPCRGNTDARTKGLGNAAGSRSIPLVTRQT